MPPYASKSINITLYHRVLPWARYFGAYQIAATMSATISRHVNSFMSHVDAYMRKCAYAEQKQF